MIMTTKTAMIGQVERQTEAMILIALAAAGKLQINQSQTAYLLYQEASDSSDP